MMRRALIVLLGVLLLCAGSAFAVLTPEAKCEALKNKEAGKYIFCLQKAEAKMHVSGADVFADSIHEDMYAAIDALVDKLDRQVKKHKEKLTDHHRSEGSIKNQI